MTTGMLGKLVTACLIDWQWVPVVSGARIDASDAFDKLTSHCYTASGNRRQRKIRDTVVTVT